MNSRHLKVSYHQPISEAPLGQLPPMPFLRLHRRCLDRAGFAVGANVRVQVEPGRLVLEMMDLA